MTEQGPGLSVGAMARRLGVAPATLRTWDLRYGIGPGRRSEGSHRRYDPADVARLEIMHRLILDGVPPAEAARTALSASQDTPVAADTEHRRVARSRDTSPPEPEQQPGPGSWQAQGGGGERLRQGGGGSQARQGGGGGGGNRLRLGTADPAARGLARAAMALDSPAIAAAVDAAITAHGVVAAWESLIAPVLVAVGERHARTGACVDIEHLLSGVVMTRLAAVPRRSAPVNAQPILLACAPEEQHSLPLCALEAALAEAGVATLALGARVPGRALNDAVRRVGPPAVVLWSQTSMTGDPGGLPELPRRRPPVRLLVGGPGWDRDRLPEHVRLLATLSEATAELLSLLHLA